VPCRKCFTQRIKPPKEHFGHVNENNRNPNIFGLHQRDLSDDRKKSFVRACQKSVLFIYEEKGDDAPHVIQTLVFLTDACSHHFE